MILLQRFLFAFYIITQVNCQEAGKLNVIADMPSSLKESSGMAAYDYNALWVMEDGGNHDKIYKLDYEGNIKKELKVKNGKNHDWEDLTTDVNGNLYIGDFGNNNSNRKDLVVYKLPNPETEKGDKITAEKIEFSYPNQDEFPPKKSKLYFDAEAFFHWNGFLYIITKNRSRPYDGKAYLYSVPDQEGEYEASFLGEWITCLNQNTCSVTSADISSDGKTIAVLSNGLVWLITNFKFDDFSKGNIRKVDLGIRTQLESICFIDDATLLLSDERSHHEGGNIYRYSIK